MPMKISKWQLMKVIRRHIRLSEKRNPAYDQNKLAKAFVYIGFGGVLLYLMFISVMLALIANESDSYTACELMFGMLPFILTIDFLVRFMAQQTPAQMVKPYILLPLGKYTCVDCFLFNTLVSSGNLVWFALFLPYAIMSVVFSAGLLPAIGFLLALYLIILANSQWYLLARTLINKHFAWWLLPIAVYALLYSPWYIGKNADVTTLCDTYATIGHHVEHGWLPVYAAIVALLLALLAINRRVQYASIYSELSRHEDTHLRHVSQLTLFDRYGEIGEYLKLEVKSIMRNKNIRKGFISANLLVLVFSVLISFTDIYDGGMTVFLCVYNFAVYGSMILSRTMCYEGNYIDCLMVRKENIISLLKAKYILYSLILIAPLLLMLPTLFTGKCTVLMLAAVITLTMGPVYCIFMHTAIINKQTIPLNTKFVGRAGMENNYMQLVVSFAALFVSPLVVGLLPLLLGDRWGYLSIIAIGMAFILTHNYWIRNIYVRMMRRRYENLEGFRSTR